MRFFKLVSVSEAEEIIRKIAEPLTEEYVPLNNSLKRTLATPIYAQTNIPGFRKSTKDGYAVSSKDVKDATEHKPVLLTCTGKILMGQNDSTQIREKETRYIPTGGVVPVGADAIVMQENSERIGEMVAIKSQVNPGSDIIGADDDFAKGEEVFPKGYTITPQGTGVLASLGVDPVPVICIPKIGVISTGNELVPASETPALGQVRDANSSLICSFLKEHGAKPQFYGIVRDEIEAVTLVLKKAVEENDAVIISGGSSKDERDVTAKVIQALGEIHVHGVSVAPGKPTIIGTVSNKPVIGLPGHPASTYMITTLFIGTLLKVMTGKISKEKIIQAKLSMSFPSEKGREDLVRVKFQSDGTVKPVLGASGLLNTLIRSDGYIRVPAGLDGYETGEVVEVYLWE